VDGARRRGAGNGFEAGRVALPFQSMIDEANRRALEETFAHFDRDANGRIDRAEFTAILTKLGAALSEAEAEAAFQDIDSDSDGSIDLEELASWWKFPANEPRTLRSG
jgi:Ca2+-binding EF-hand superfamily protein